MFVLAFAFVLANNRMKNEMMLTVVASGDLTGLAMVMEKWRVKHNASVFRERQGQ